MPQVVTLLFQSPSKEDFKKKVLDKHIILSIASTYYHILFESIRSYLVSVYIRQWLEPADYLWGEWAPN